MNKGWLELESDPGLFTLLLEDFGVNGVQVEEIYDLAKPIEGQVFGFIFLFRWIEERRSRRKANTEVDSFVTDAEVVSNIFFAQQIIPNSCATHALLSVLLNCDNRLKLGEMLDLIKDFTDSMSPEDKGLAIANMPQLAKVHNSYARPECAKPIPEKQSGLSSVRATDSETFHFVSYVPIKGHLFELDGLKPHPIDHGPWEKDEMWTEKFRRVIGDRLKSVGENDIRFNLMAVVPDRRQLLEQKLCTLKTNRNIVIEALQQGNSTESLKTESETKTMQDAKKSVTFASEDSQSSKKSEASKEENENPKSEQTDDQNSPHSSFSSKSKSPHPTSILKSTLSSDITQITNSTSANSQSKLETNVDKNSCNQNVSKDIDSKSECKEVVNTVDTKLESGNVEMKVETEVVHSASTDLVEVEVKSSDVTVPLLIETKFTVSPCTVSSESTDTASELGSGFSSPGSLQTSSCQSSPNTNLITDIKQEEGEHPIRNRKRKSNHDFTPKDLLDLLKNIDNEIEVYELNLYEEQEKYKKFRIDACRRTHNYDQFVMTFLEMLAEQGHLGELMEQHMPVKKHGTTTPAPTGNKVAKKALIKAEKKKQKGKIKKKGKK